MQEWVFRNGLLVVMHTPVLSDVDTVNTGLRVILCAELVEQFPLSLVAFKQALSFNATTQYS